MRGKAIAYSAMCILWIGVGIGSAGALFLIRPLRVIAICGAFFCAGAFFVLAVRARRQSAKMK